MRDYTNFKVTEGTTKNFVEEFATFEEALAYIEKEYGADNTVELLVQIDAYNEDEWAETFNELEIYDMIAGDQKDE